MLGDVGLKPLKKSMNLKPHTTFSLDGYLKVFKRFLLDSTTSFWKNFLVSLQMGWLYLHLIPKPSLYNLPMLLCLSALNLQKCRESGKKWNRKNKTEIKFLFFRKNKTEIKFN